MSVKKLNEKLSIISRVVVLPKYRSIGLGTKLVRETLPLVGTPHCCRHWFTTHLRRNGIRRELLKELRGDSRGEAVDIYDHIDRKELKRANLVAIPELGI